MVFAHAFSFRALHWFQVLAIVAISALHLPSQCEVHIRQKDCGNRKWAVIQVFHMHIVIESYELRTRGLCVVDNNSSLPPGPSK